MTESKKKLIKHIQNDVYCRIGVSKIDGVGVIAIKEIPAGIFPFKTLSDKKEKIIKLDKNDLIHVDKNVVRFVHDMFGGENDYCILSSGPNDINISFYMNHSDEPNVDIICEDTSGKSYCTFKTNRLIKKGEELTINYNMYK